MLIIPFEFINLEQIPKTIFSCDPYVQTTPLSALMFLQNFCLFSLILKFFNFVSIYEVTMELALK